MFFPIQAIHTNDLLVFVLGVLLNAVIIRLVNTNSTAAMRPYRPVLLFVSYANINLVTCYMLVMPVELDDSGKTILLSSGPLWFVPNPIAFGVMIWWTACLLIVFYHPVVPFIYRFFVICLDWQASHTLYYKLLAIPVLLSLGELSMYLYIAFPTPELEAMSVTFLNNLTDNGTFGYIPSRIEWDPVTMMDINYYIFSCMGFEYAIIIVLGITVYIKLWLMIRKSGSDLATTKVNQQMGMALLMQAMTPFAFQWGPTFFTIFHESSSSTVNTSPYLLGTLEWTCVVDPILTILVVKSFRKAVVKALTGMACAGENKLTNHSVIGVSSIAVTGMRSGRPTMTVGGA